MNGNGEIIIVRRASEHDDSHHGGMWKIAFADFMTAMMALFLVLWLINAANEETKQSVASYFNPVKLVDDRRTVKGMSKSDSEEPAEDNKGAEAGETESPKTQAEQFEHNQPSMNAAPDSSYLANPTQLLDSLASKERALLTAKGELVADPGVEKTAEFADPFAPNFWQPLRVVASEGDPEARIFDQETSENGTLGVLEDGPGNSAQDVAEAPRGEEEAAAADSGAESRQTGAADEVASVDGSEIAQDGSAAEASETTDAADSLQAALQEAIASETGSEGQIAEALSVVRVPEGLKIALTDDLPEQMFELGSAVPTAGVVLALEAVGRELQKRPGRIFIYGHTDSRPMRDSNDDNWRLSTDRARSVYFMLLRGGLEDGRITQIAGFADRQPVNPDNGLDPRNRRIEILLEAP